MMRFGSKHGRKCLNALEDSKFANHVNGYIIKRLQKVWGKQKVFRNLYVVHLAWQSKFTGKLQCLFSISPAVWKTIFNQQDMSTAEDITYLDILVKKEKMVGLEAQEHVLASERILKIEQMRISKEKRRNFIESNARKDRI